jgi:hypothetical protein
MNKQSLCSRNRCDHSHSIQILNNAHMLIFDYFNSMSFFHQIEIVPCKNKTFNFVFFFPSKHALFFRIEFFQKQKKKKKKKKMSTPTRKKKASLKDFAVKLNATVIAPGSALEHQLVDNDDNSFVISFKAPAAGTYTVVINSTVHPPRTGSRTRVKPRTASNASNSSDKNNSGNNNDDESSGSSFEDDSPLPATPALVVEKAVPSHKPPPVPLSSAPLKSPRAVSTDTDTTAAAAAAATPPEDTSERVSFGAAPITAKPGVAMQRYTSTPHAVSTIATFRQPPSPREQPLLPPRRPMRGRAMPRCRSSRRSLRRCTGPDASWGRW